MAHPDSLFHDDPGIDPFLSSLGGDGGTLTPEQLDQLFAVEAPHTSSSTDSDFDDIFSRLDDDSAFTGSSSNDTTVSSTPDFAAFSFDGRGTSVYPTPSPVTTHPYPLQIQPKHHHYPHQHRIQQQHTLRPSTHRSHTNIPTPDHGQYSRVQQPPHRRSLSQGDADRIAAATQQTQNPVFFRLQTPRSRSVTPDDDGGRLKASIRGRVHRHCANANQGAVYGHANPRTTVGTPMPTSAPVDARTVQRIVVPTNIGTPMGDYERRHRDAEAQSVHTFMQLGPHTDSDHPQFRYMDPQEQVRKSWRVIEVGAMGVVSKQISHNTEDGGEKEEKGSKKDRMLEKLEEVEKHLKLDPGGREEALQGCAMIRGALEWEEEARKDGDVGRMMTSPHNQPVADDNTVAPSTVFSKDDNELYHTDTDGLVSMLVTRPLGDENDESHAC